MFNIITHCTRYMWKDSTSFLQRGGVKLRGGAIVSKMYVPHEEQTQV